jgi:hypothetical protein
MARCLAVLVAAAAVLAALLSGGPAGAAPVRPAPASARPAPIATPRQIAGGRGADHDAGQRLRGRDGAGGGRPG